MGREARLKVISRAGWEVKSSDHPCSEYSVSSRPSKDPKNVDYVPTLFKYTRRRLANMAASSKFGQDATSPIGNVESSGA